MVDEIYPIPGQRQRLAFTRAAAGALSIYDYGTTFAGLGTVVWLQQAGWLIRGALTLVLTFALESVVSVALRRR